MNELNTGFVGLDAHAQSTAIALAEVGREVPRFVGTVGAKLSELTKALHWVNHRACRWCTRPGPAVTPWRAS